MDLKHATDAAPAGPSEATLAWTEVRVLVPRGWEELVAELLAEHSPSGTAYGRSSLAQPAPPASHELVRAWILGDERQVERRAAIALLLAGLAERTGEPELAGLVPEFKSLPPEDYATSWRKGWKAFRLGKLCLLPPWDARPIRRGELRLTIEPGAAFGSGRHATTRTCLRALLARLAPGERVLDAGSGSGILAVAAVLAGARSALGFDVDPLTAPIASALARSNGVADRCEFRAGGFEVLGQEDTGFGGVLANIYADVIQERAAELRARLAPGGWFVFGGCNALHAAATRRVIESVGLSIDAEPVRGRWHAFVGTRPPEPPSVAARGR